MSSGRVSLITGGAGFVGSNLARRLLEDGERVVLLDNLSRASVERNVEWLRHFYERRCELRVGDIRDPEVVKRAIADASTVFHFAAQGAVPTSLKGPVHDFEVNARGTLNVLEAIRAQRNPPGLLFTSARSVYGGLADLPLKGAGSRYEPASEEVRTFGISEERPLDFHTPYGCSKGTADQYVHDYARSYGLRAVVFRMSCVYGPRQIGTEGQGFIAHFIARALRGEPLTIYGDGRQVRDALFVGDLVEAFVRARDQLASLGGMAFNIGGGPTNALSLLELAELIAELHGKKPLLTFQDWRPGDPRYYVSDTRRFGSFTGWRPRVALREGITRLHRWLADAEPKAPPPPLVVESA